MKVNTSFFCNNLDYIWKYKKGSLFVYFQNVLLFYKKFCLAKKQVFFIEAWNIEDSFTKYFQSTVN